MRSRVRPFDKVIGAAAAFLLISACSTGSPEPIIVREPVEVFVEVPVACEIDAPSVEGPDFAPADSNIEYAAIYAEGRIIGLRREVKNLRAAVENCNNAVESVADKAERVEK